MAQNGCSSVSAHPVEEKEEEEEEEEEVEVEVVVVEKEEGEEISWKEEAGHIHDTMLLVYTCIIYNQLPTDTHGG